MTSLLRVRAAGVHTSIQDRGRPGFARLGVSPGGACDPDSLALANELLLNDAAAPALEVTLGGLELEVLETTVIALAGADLGGQLVDEGRPLRPGLAHLVRRGSVLRFDGATHARDGCRSYLALAGGVEAPRVLGSASMDPSLGGPGLVGRPIAAGDLIRASARAPLELAGRRWTGASFVPLPEPVAVRVVRGPHAPLIHRSAVSRMLDTVWTVAPDSDRRGVRLDGPSLDASAPGLVSVPMRPGAIQLPPDGRPIALLADHQTVGGYPVLAVVIAADRPLLGQLAPGASLRLQAVSLGEALAAAVAAQRDREEWHWRIASET